jgi:hypothetical protein
LFSVFFGEGSLLGSRQDLQYHLGRAAQSDARRSDYDWTIDEDRVRQHVVDELLV